MFRLGPDPRHIISPQSAWLPEQSSVPLRSCVALDTPGRKWQRYTIDLSHHQGNHPKASKCPNHFCVFPWHAFGFCNLITSGAFCPFKTDGICYEVTEESVLTQFKQLILQKVLYSCKWMNGWVKKALKVSRSTNSTSRCQKLCRWSCIKISLVCALFTPISATDPLVFPSRSSKPGAKCHEKKTESSTDHFLSKWTETTRWWHSKTIYIYKHTLTIWYIV